MAFAIDEVGDDSFTLEPFVARENLPFREIAVAVAFLEERGIVQMYYRRNRAGTGGVHLDAMTDYCVPLRLRIPALLQPPHDHIAIQRLEFHLVRTPHQFHSGRRPGSRLLISWSVATGPALLSGPGQNTACRPA